MSAKIRVNGSEHRLADDARRDVLAVLVSLGLAERKGVAVAVNGSVVGRSRWPETSLAEGDEVLVIQATQGG